MTEKQAQTGLERWRESGRTAERLKGELRQLERWTDERQTPGLSRTQRGRLRRQAKKQAAGLERALSALMAEQAYWHKATETLPPLQAAILAMRYGEGLTWRRIAERTGYSEKHLFKIRRAAITALGRGDED